MSDTTEISWTDATFNHVIGCQRVAPGCQACYAEAFANRFGKAKWGPQGTRVKTSEVNWRKPLKWNRDAEKAGVRRLEHDGWNTALQQFRHLWDQLNGTRSGGIYAWDRGPFVWVVSFKRLEIA